MNRRCASNFCYTLSCQNGRKLKAEERRLIKENKKVDGVLKDAKMKNENEGDSEEQNKAERNVYGMLEKSYSYITYSYYTV